MTALPACWNTEEKVVFCPELGYNKSVMDKRSVGIFDSGLGGLTAVSALHALLPEENIIYFGDTARNPYGTRPPEQLRKMARENLDLMASFNVKAVIAACGTMSTNATEVLRQSETPVFNVLDASVKAMAAVPGERPLGVIATDASIRSGGFTRALQLSCPGREILAVPCQQFVALCESGRTAPEDGEVRTAVEHHLKPLKEAGITALLLGCTHFGLMGEAISAYLGGDVKLVSASACAAGAMARFLTENALTGGDGEIRYFTSGETSNFEKMAEVFLGVPVRAERAFAGEDT